MIFLYNQLINTVESISFNVNLLFFINVHCCQCRCLQLCGMFHVLWQPFVIASGQHQSLVNQQSKGWKNDGNMWILWPVCSFIFPCSEASVFGWQWDPLLLKIDGTCWKWIWQVDGTGPLLRDTPFFWWDPTIARWWGSEEIRNRKFYHFKQTAFECRFHIVTNSFRDFFGSSTVPRSVFHFSPRQSMACCQQTRAFFPGT